MEELIKALETIKNYCDKTRCGICQIEEWCGYYLKDDGVPAVWEIPEKE